MAANAHRGEIAIRLDADYVLRPDFEAVAAIDEQLGSVLDAARDAAGGKISYRVAAVVICEGLKASGRASGDRALQAVNLRRVQELIFDVGLLTVLEPVSRFLVAAVMGGVEPGEAEAEAKATN